MMMRCISNQEGNVDIAHERASHVYVTKLALSRPFSYLKCKWDALYLNIYYENIFFWVKEKNNETVITHRYVYKGGRGGSGAPLRSKKMDAWWWCFRDVSRVRSRAGPLGWKSGASKTHLSWPQTNIINHHEKRRRGTPRAALIHFKL